MNAREIEIYDEMIELGIATEEEINLVRCLVAGSWEEILNDICFARTGYRDWEQFKECEMEEEE